MGPGPKSRPGPPISAPTMQPHRPNVLSEGKGGDEGCQSFQSDWRDRKCSLAMMGINLTFQVDLVW